MAIYRTLEEMVVSVAEVVRPPERLTVSQAAEKYRYVNMPGSYVGPWLNDKTPYMVEPMDACASLDFTSVVFVGPAQSGKTDSLLINYLLYTAIVDPADLMMINMTQTTARDFAKRRIERLFRNSPEAGKRVLPGRQNQNIFDVRFRAGTMLNLSWPSITELSGRPIPRLMLTDYDRMDQDVDGEGSPFDLARKRTTTFGRFGMTIAESSPGFEVKNIKGWIPKSKHEGPPTDGIIALYNRGDRRRWYWRCPTCDTPFEPTFDRLTWPDSHDIAEASELASMVCPGCRGHIQHAAKRSLNTEGRWIKDGEIWMPDRSIGGRGVKSDTASFWLMGVAAAFADWKTLVSRYLTAEGEYEKTGDQTSLKATINTDQGLPYIPKNATGGRAPEEIKSRAVPIGEKVVPEGVRFLVATIDVQGNRFVVQVHGVGRGLDIWLIDRFHVQKSNRLDDDMEHLWVKPGAYAEDWHLLVDAVVKKTYPLADGSGRKMMVKAVGCDSGGQEGVTVNAYAFWRWLRDEEETGGLDRRFMLIKGSSVATAPRVSVTYPDAERKDRRAASHGEVPVLMINANTLKDHVDSMLDRTEPGGGMITFPEWLPDWFYSELTVETRTPKGWKNPLGHRNESWDLLVYCVAVCLSRLINYEMIDWTKPPSWAEEWDKNDLVFSGENDALPFQPTKKYKLGDLGSRLG